MLGYPGILGVWKRNIKDRVTARSAGGREMLRVGSMPMPAVVSEAQGF